jgi:uncharacterized protein (TIGR02246 family)
MRNAFSALAKRSLTCLMLLALSAIGLEIVPARGAENKPGDESDQAAIRAAAEAFVRSFNQADAKAVAAMWAENGTVADDGGRIFKGRKAIEEEYAAFFKKHPGARIEIAVQSVDLPTPSLAIEDGFARVVAKNSQMPVASRYTAVHVLQDGKWLMASVRESAMVVPSAYGRLQELEWLVGTWETKTDNGVVQTSFRWLANNSFLQREYTIRQNGLTVSSGAQIIGWDPQAGKIRSWSFDGSGGYGTALWSLTGDGWSMESNGVTNDGTPTSSKDFLIRIPGERNVFGWRSVNRTIGDVRLPDLPEVVLDRLEEKH